MILRVNKDIVVFDPVTRLLNEHNVSVDGKNLCG